MDILHIFVMVDCKSINTMKDFNLRKFHETKTGSDPKETKLYRQLIGSFMYLIHSRSDIFYAVKILSQFITNPRHTHWFAGKNILRYLRGIVSYGLRHASKG